MNPTISLCANVYQDAAALRGLLEVGARYFDNLFIAHTGPGGAYSTDGTIELCEQFGATIIYDDIQKGFGVIRSRLIHECGCSWAFLLDADERYWPLIETMECYGTESYPAQQEPKLTVVHRKEVINQGAQLKEMIKRNDIDSIRSSRRHWFDFAMKRPSQNWFGPNGNKDHQLRIVRNTTDIGYEKGRVMHERLLDYRTGRTPRFAEQDEYGGQFHDHYHLHFRRTQPGKKEKNEENYSRLERGEKMIV